MISSPFGPRADYCRGGKGSERRPTTRIAKPAASNVQTSLDDLGYGLGVALTGVGRDRVAMKRGANLGFRDGFAASPNGVGGGGIVDDVPDALARAMARIREAISAARGVKIAVVWRLIPSKRRVAGLDRQSLFQFWIVRFSRPV